MASELTTAEKWMVGVLRADAAMAALVGDRVFVGVVPQADPGETLLPCVLIQPYPPKRDARTQWGRRLLTQARYTVRAIGEGTSRQAIAPVYARADEVLHGASGRVAEGSVGYCLREMPIPDQTFTTDQGERLASVGGLYDVAVKAA